MHDDPLRTSFVFILSTDELDRDHFPLNQIFLAGRKIRPSLLTQRGSEMVKVFPRSWGNDVSPRVGISGDCPHPRVDPFPSREKPFEITLIAWAEALPVGDRVILPP